MIRLRYAPVWDAVGYLLVAVILALSLMPDAPVPGGPDWGGHALAYFVLAAWFYAMFPERLWQVALGCLALGGVIELIQGLLPFRDMDGFDFVADAVGVVLAWLLVGPRLRRAWRWFEGRIVGAL